MKRARFTDEQIVRILREADQHPVAETAKKHGVSDVTIYAWRKRFGAMENQEVKKLKNLETENSRLKKLLAERDLEIEIMKEIAAKKW
jgi:putative transposase